MILMFTESVSARSCPSSDAIVFIDTALEDYRHLANGVISGTEVVLLDSSWDGVEQITQALADRPSVKTVHILSHGSPGCLYLGNAELSLATIDRYRQSVQQWFNAANSDRSLLLYGCNVACGDAGAELVERLHNLTGAEIAASRSLTGNAALGGNWNLEVKTGDVAVTAFTPAALETYAGVLAAVNPGNVTLKGGGVTWNLSNQIGTSNGQPAGGTSNGSPGFGLSSATTSGQSAGPSGINNGLLFINNQAYVAAANADLTGSTLTTTSSQPLSGLNVSQQFYADQTDPVLRNFVSLSNPTNAAITVTISWATNLGHNASRELKAVSNVPINNPGAIARWPNISFPSPESNVRWLIADDDDSAAGKTENFRDGGGSNFFRPALTQVLGGPGSPTVTPSSIDDIVFADGLANPASAYDVQNSKNGVLVNYSVTIPANSTRSLLLFYGLNDTTRQAIDYASGIDVTYNGTTAVYTPSGPAVYNDVSALKATSLLNGLTAKQLSETVNWNLTSPGFTTTATAGLKTTEAGGKATYAIALTSQPTADVTITLASSDASEGTISSPITFTPANWDTAQTVTITGVDDAAKDGDVTYKITSTITSADSTYAALDPSTALPDVSVINVDNDSNNGSNNSGGNSNGGSGNGNGNNGGNGSNPGKRIQGSGRNDNLKGTRKDDTLLGLNGNDKLVGGSGNDTLRGGKGNDKEYGQAGRDTLYGDAGRNTLVGGADRDTFVLSTEGVAVIKDFQNNLDRLGLTGKLKFKDLDIIKQGRNTIIETKKGDDVLAIVTGVHPKAITSADFTKV